MYLFNLSLISLYSAFEHCIMDMWRFRNEYNNNNNNKKMEWYGVLLRPFMQSSLDTYCMHSDIN